MKNTTKFFLLGMIISIVSLIIPGKIVENYHAFGYPFSYLNYHTVTQEYIKSIDLLRLGDISNLEFKLVGFFVNSVALGLLVYVLYWIVAKIKKKLFK